jgi:hypothetical protein
MTEPALDFDLDFSRYAPSPPRLVVRQEVAAPGELALAFGEIAHALGVIWRCLVFAAATIWRRGALWFEIRILHSLHAAWSIGSIGWGAFLSLFAIELFMR